MIILQVVTFAGLAVNTVLDTISRRISLIIVGVIGVCGLCWRLANGTLITADAFWGLLPGGLCFLLAKLTNESVGYGDAWVLLAAGIVLGGGDIILMCTTAVFAAGICALVLIVFFHKGRKYQMPFLPFLMLGYICVIGMRYFG